MEEKKPKSWITYTAASGLVLTAVALFAQGHFDQAVQTLLAALGLFGLRRAMSKME